MGTAEVDIGTRFFGGRQLHDHYSVAYTRGEGRAHDAESEPNTQLKPEVGVLRIQLSSVSLGPKISDDCAPAAGSPLT